LLNGDIGRIIKKGITVALLTDCGYGDVLIKYLQQDAEIQNYLSPLFLSEGQPFSP
jgi:hypothetical protein